MSPYIECPAGPRYRPSIPEAPITEKYKAHVPPENSQLKNSGLAYATYAPTSESPHGTEKDDWAEKHQHQTVRHVALSRITVTDTFDVTGP